MKILREEECILMDKVESLLLLDDPILIDIKWAKKLFPEKPEDYWCHGFVQKIGSITRNRHIRPAELKLIIGELWRRYTSGSINYLGQNYKKLLNTCERKSNYTLSRYIM